MPLPLALINSAADGDPHSLAQLLAVVERSLGEALTDADLRVSGAAADATVSVLCAQSVLFGVLPPAAALAGWPLDSVPDLLVPITRGLRRVDVPLHRAEDVYAALDLLASASLTVAAALR